MDDEVVEFADFLLQQKVPVSVVRVAEEQKLTHAVVNLMTESDVNTLFPCMGDKLLFRSIMEMIQKVCTSNDLRSSAWGPAECVIDGLDLHSKNGIAVLTNMMNEYESHPTKISILFLQCTFGPPHCPPPLFSSQMYTSDITSAEIV